MSRFNKRRKFGTAPKPRYGKLSSLMRRGRVGRARDTVHWFTRYTEAAGNMTNISVTGGKSLYITLPSGQTGISFTYAPCINDVVNVSEFSALYDQYKILRAQFTFRLMTNPNAIESLGTNATTSTANFYPSIWLMPDHDDINATNLATIRQCNRAKRFVLRPNSFLRYSIRPTTLTQVYDGIITTAYSVNKPQWLDISRTDTPHYGLKAYVDTEGVASNTDNFIIAMECKLIFGMKGVR